VGKEANVRHGRVPAGFMDQDVTGDSMTCDMHDRVRFSEGYSHND